MTLLDLAIDYAERGWPVFPLEPQGKHPIGQLAPHGLKDATTDEETIRRWWERAPEANIGIPTGIIFDVGDFDNEEAMNAFIAICGEHGIDPRKLPRAKTGGGGRHVLFQPTGIGNKAKFIPGTDWRGMGGYIVAPGSVHPNGELYEWISSPNGTLPPVPEWLLERLKPSHEPSEPRRAVGDPPPEAYVERAVQDEMDRLRGTPDGARNNQLNTSAFALGQMVGAGWLSYGRAEAELRAAAYAIDHGHEPGMSATIHSGLNAGVKEPRAEPADGWRTPAGEIRHGPGAAESNGEAPNADEPYAIPLHDFIAHPTESAVPLIGTNDDVLLPTGGFLLLFARGGKGKTTLSIDAALCLASGVEWLGFDVPRPLRVLIVENEGPMEPFRRKLERKLASWAYQIDGAIFIKTSNWGAFTINQEDEQVALRRFIDENGIDLVMGDPLDSMGAKGVGSPEDTREFMAGLVKVGLTRDVAFWLLHHANKAEWEDELDEVSGAWGGKPDTMLKLAKEPGNRARLSFPKVRWGSHQRPANFLAFDPDTEGFTVAGVEQTEERDVFQEVRQLLEDGTLRTVREISAPKKKGGIGIKEEAVKSVLENHPDVFTGVNGAAIGRSPQATFWRLA